MYVRKDRRQAVGVSRSAEETPEQQQVPRRPEGGLARDDSLKHGVKPDDRWGLGCLEAGAASSAPTKKRGRAGDPQYVLDMVFETEGRMVPR
jgi:hypothetical protein